MEKIMIRSICRSWLAFALLLIPSTFYVTACGPIPDETPTAEVCDGLDNDLDGVADEGVATTFYFDLDGDGYGDPLVSEVGCEAPDSRYVEDATDCNDHNPADYPGAPEDCDDRDNSCEGEIDEDSDGDGFDACDEVRCLEGDASVYPGNDADGDGVPCEKECSKTGDLDAGEYPGNGELSLTCAPL